MFMFDVAKVRCGRKGKMAKHRETTGRGWILWPGSQNAVLIRFATPWRFSEDSNLDSSIFQCLVISCTHFLAADKKGEWNGDG